MASRAQRVTYSALFAVLMALGAYLAIPIGEVPFTLQTFFVYLVGLVLDPWAATGSQVLYVLLGTAGLPVFANGGGGPQVLLGPTGGFLLAFPLAALAESILAGRRRRGGDIIALAGAFTIVFTLGIAFFLLYFRSGDVLAVATSFSPFMAWDAIKAALAYAVGRRLRVVAGGQLTSGRR
ncbi:MAG: biotin transporter BioY [Conexivisphaerales archaeon]